MSTKDHPRPRSNHNSRPLYVEPNRINDAVHDCVQLAYGQKSPAAFVYRYVQELVTSGWTRQDADQVGSRAIGVLNAATLPPTKKAWG